MSEVTTIHSNLVGAPTLSYAQGSLCAVLDAALSDGFGAGTVDSLVIVGGVATMTRAAGNPLEEHMLVDVSGITTPAGLNGKHRVLSRSATAVTFSAAGFGDQTATGTIVQKAAPLGWAKEFTATNKRVYRSPNTSGTRMYLRIDESAANRYARARSYETMSDVDTGTGPCPTDVQVSGGAYVTKTDATSGSASRPWAVIGDDRGFYFIGFYHGSFAGSCHGAYFGDVAPVFGGVDPWAFLVAAHSADYGSAPPGQIGINYMSGAAPAWVQRGATGLAGALQTARTGVSPRDAATGLDSGGASNNLSYPTPEGEMLASPVYAVDLAPPYQNRGEYPGFQWLMQGPTAPYLAAWDFVDGADDLAGRKLRAFPGSAGRWLVDVTGPWR